MHNPFAEARPHHGNLIHHPRQMRKQVRDLDATLSAFAEGAGTGQQLGPLLNLLVLRLAEFRGTDLTVQLGEQRLGIERIHMAGAPRHKQEDDRAGRGVEVGRAGLQRRVARPLCDTRVERRRRKGPETAVGGRQELAAFPGV